MRNPQSDYWARKCCEKVRGLPLWVAATHIAWGGQCALQCADCGGPLRAHHILGRPKRLRYNLRNLMLLCEDHHAGNAGWWGHAKGRQMIPALQSQYPELVEWIQVIAPMLDNHAWLQGWDWEMDYLTLKAVLAKENDYIGTCRALGVRETENE